MGYVVIYLERIFNPPGVALYSDHSSTVLLLIEGKSLKRGLPTIWTLPSARGGGTIWPLAIAGPWSIIRGGGYSTDSPQTPVSTGFVTQFWISWAVSLFFGHMSDSAIRFYLPSTASLIFPIKRFIGTKILSKHSRRDQRPLGQAWWIFLSPSIR